MLCVAKCVENIAHEKQFIRLNLREEKPRIRKGKFSFQTGESFKASKNDVGKETVLER